MKTTKNFFLKIFEGIDNFDYKIISENWEKIDNALDELLNGGNKAILPTITIERIENGYRITTNDAKGSQSIDLIPDELNKTGVVAGSYGGYDTSNSVYKIPNVTVDEYGRVTEASNSALGFVSKKGSGILSASDYNNFKSSVIKYKYGTQRYITEPLSVYFLIDVITATDANREPIPRVLNVLIHIYINATKTRKYWVSVPYDTWVGTDSKSDDVWTYLSFKIPEEYAEYNLTELANEDGTVYDGYEHEYMIEYVAAT